MAAVPGMGEAVAGTGARRAPGPKGNSLFGFLNGLRRDPIGLFQQAKQAYGDVVRWQVGPVAVHAVFHPDDVQRVLQEHSKNYSKQSPGYDKLRLALGDGLLTSEGEVWRRQRRIMQPAFHRERLRGFGRAMTACTGAMLERWDAQACTGAPLDVAAEMMRLTLEIICQTMFSSEMGDRAQTLGDMMTIALHHLHARIASPASVLTFLDRLPTPQNRRFWKALRAGDELVFQVLAERRAAKVPPDDLLGMLMSARDEETGEAMTDRQLRDEIIVIFGAGHETTANALAWTFSLLSQHPTALRTLLCELDSVLAGRVATVDDLPPLEYTMMVIKEAMRLYPPAWSISRAAIADDVLGGFRIPAGSAVVTCPYLTQRDPRFWDNPEGFDPERFRGDAAASRPKFAYFPFGGGPRLCIGQGFAMMETQLVLATVLSRYQLELMPGRVPVPEPVITLRPKAGVWVTLKSRASATPLPPARDEAPAGQQP
jgi:cytochrome P450